MTLTTTEAKEALQTAIRGGLAELESGTPVISQDGAMFQFVSQIPLVQPRVFALGFVFVSEDEQRMIELHRRLSAYLEAGLPKG